MPSGALCLGTLREHGQLRKQKGIAQEDDMREKQHQMRMWKERRKVNEGAETPLFLGTPEERRSSAQTGLCLCSVLLEPVAFNN